MQYDDSNIFAKILRKEIPADVVYEDDKVLAFNDINPQAPVHILIIPKVDVATVHDVVPEHNEYLGSMIAAAQKIAGERGISESGYRLVINCREGAGQTVFHLHMHLLGGRPLLWPPG